MNLIILYSVRTSTSLLAGLKAGRVYLCRVAGVIPNDRQVTPSGSVRSYSI